MVWGASFFVISTNLRNEMMLRIHGKMRIKDTKCVHMVTQSYVNSDSSAPSWCNIIYYKLLQYIWISQTVYIAYPFFTAMFALEVRLHRLHAEIVANVE